MVGLLSSLLFHSSLDFISSPHPSCLFPDTMLPWYQWIIDDKGHPEEEPLLEGRMAGWTDGQVDGQLARWMEGRKFNGMIPSYPYLLSMQKERSIRNK